MTASPYDSDVLELVLGKLEGMRQHGGYWMARCPAHEDRQASLSVRRGTKQPVILHCHAGCDLDAILAELGLTRADVSKPREESRPGAWAEPAAVYDYTDERGKLLFQVCRMPGKKFRQRRPDPAGRDGWTWNLKDVRRVPYHLPQLRRAARGPVAGRVAYIVEGEKDVAAVEAAGAVATCNPGGAGKWRPEYGKHFTGIRAAVIVADRDEPGRKHAAQVAEMLRRHVLAVTIVEAAEGKDAADHLAARLSLDDFRPVRLESDRASDTSVGVSETADAPEQGEHHRSDTSDTSDSPGDAELLAGVRDGAWLTVQQFPPLRYAVPQLIPEGLTLLIGAPKIGKSWLALDLLLGVASGGVALGKIDVGPPRRVLYLALEDSDRRMQDRCRALLVPGEEIPGLFCYQTRVLPGMVLATIAAWMRRHPDTAIVVIDTLGKVMPPALQGESAYQRDYRIGSALKAQADAYPGLSVTVSHHDRKASADDFIDSVSGTHGLAGAADTVAVLARRRQSGDGVLKVTGRDVPEDEYALSLTDGKAWHLAGATLTAAAAEAARRVAARELSVTSAEVLKFITDHPEGVRAKDVADKFGRDAYQYLGRLVDQGRIDKVGRGFYTPVTVSEVSEVSESQVSDPADSDSSEPGSVRNPTFTWPEGSGGEEAQR